MTYPTRDEIEAGLRPFVHVANGYDNELDPDDRPVGPFMLGLCRRARDLLARLQSAPAAGDWRIVPVEPTEAMVEAGWIDKEDVDPDDIWRAMIAAAPSPIPEQQETRACTCHPSDNPPVPCPQRYALSECRAAAGEQPGATEAVCRTCGGKGWLKGNNPRRRPGTDKCPDCDGTDCAPAQPDEAAVERVAKAIHYEAGDGRDAWVDAPEHRREYYRALARAALAAVPTPAAPEVERARALVQIIRDPDSNEIGFELSEAEAVAAVVNAFAVERALAAPAKGGEG